MVLFKKCPTCKHTIGAEAYDVLAKGNKEMTGELEKNNEHGYFTLAANHRNNNNNDNNTAIPTPHGTETASLAGECENIRNMGFLNTSLMRLFLELALYSASPLCMINTSPSWWRI